MALARDVMRATIRSRREMARRNAEATAEDETWFPLEDVPWASPQAYARAVNLGLTGLMFDGEDYTGKRGFTAGDVNSIAKESEQ